MILCLLSYTVLFTGGDGMHRWQATIRVRDKEGNVVYQSSEGIGFANALGNALFNACSELMDESNVAHLNEYIKIASCIC